MTADAQYVIKPHPITSLPIHGGHLRFPVRRVFCVGRNYAAHIREMGGDPRDTPPVFFTKPADALVPTDASGVARIAYPPATADLHYEGELVMALKAGGAAIDPAAAAHCIYGYAVGLDMTRRDIQREAGASGRPWDMAKGFDQSGPVGAILPAEGTLLDRGAITLSVDGETRQQADLTSMIWTLPEIIAHLSRLVTLEPGDVIFTGTPEGVGPVSRGQRIEVGVAGLPPLTCLVE